MTRGVRSDSFAAAFEEIAFADLDFRHEVPRQDQKVVGLGAGFGFGNDGNPGAYAEFAPYLGIALGSGTNQGAIEAKNLQQSVAFGGSAVDGNFPALFALRV